MCVGAPTSFASQSRVGSSHEWEWRAPSRVAVNQAVCHREDHGEDPLRVTVRGVVGRDGSSTTGLCRLTWVGKWRNT